MAEILHQVFCIFIRPSYLDNDKRVVYKDNIYRIKEYSYCFECGYKPVVENLTTENTNSPDYSPEFINANHSFKKDVWFLHSTYTSYWECRNKLKELMKIYGKEHIKLFIYVPWDYEVTPDE